MITLVIVVACAVGPLGQPCAPHTQYLITQHQDSGRPFSSLADCNALRDLIIRQRNLFVVSSQCVSGLLPASGLRVQQ